jgi:Flp pilus assembly protein TadG
MRRMCKRLGGEQGTALLETATTLPLFLLVSVGTFEFDRAVQTWQVLTNTARDGARLAVMPSPAAGGVDARVRSSLVSG